MTNVPTGTITFLFTDIEGSTKRWESQPQAMGAAVARHDEIMRGIIETNSGYVFKTVGDAFCAAFATPHDALTAAIAAQRALHADQWSMETGPIRVRMALHTGISEERAGDYFGQPVNRVARLLSAGHGGQTLLSETTHYLVRDALQPSVEIRDMGEHRLKDLMRPERIYQVVALDLPSDFLPLNTLSTHPNNLPIHPTPIIGRDAELEVIERVLCGDTRLLTLTGPGGIGKTRLALQAAANLVIHFGDGVFFVNLAPVNDPLLVIPTIAQALGIRETSNQRLLERLENHIKNKKLLLLLDNFEQVMDASRSVAELLATAPSLRVLVTSREVLHLRGEQTLLVPPLSIPNSRRLPPIEHLTQYDAVRLFIVRASEAKPDFVVTDENAPAITEICHRLDGLPLAIELAAARIRLLPPSAMLLRLENKLKLLTGGARDLPSRQQTLQSTIEWSYDLLLEEEQKLLRRLSVFLGGRTLEAVEAVCNARGDLEIDVLDVVEALVRKSLLRETAGPNEEPRFVMLETIHEFGRQKLNECGEAEEMCARHTEFFLELAEQAQEHLRGPKQATWLERLEPERDNFRAVLEWTLGADKKREYNKHTEEGLRLASALQRFWEMRGPTSEGQRWLKRAVERSAAAPVSLRAKLLTGAGTVTWRRRSYPEAAEYHKQALELYTELADKQGIAFASNNVGSQLYCQGDYQQATVFFDRALALYRELGDKRGISMILNNMGENARIRGDYAGAKALYEEVLALRRELDDHYGIAMVLANLAYVACHEDGFQRAWDLFAENLTMSDKVGDKYHVALCLEGIGVVLGRCGQIEQAGKLMGAGQALLDELGTPLPAADQMEYQGALDEIHSQADEAEFAVWCAEGQAMSVEQAIVYALATGSVRTGSR